MGPTWNIRGLRRALTPRRGVLRSVARAPLLILLATCQVDKLTNTPPPVATLSLAPDQVSDSAAVGSLRVNHDSLAVVNTGPGTLSWSARLAMGEPWLAFVGPTGGTAPAKLRLAFNPACLPTGIYRDTVVVAAENAAGSPGRVPVEFAVHPCLAAPLVLNAQVTDSITTWDCAAPHRPTGFARVYAFSAQANDSISVVMSSTPLNAYLVLDSSTTPTAPPLAFNDSCSGGGRDACLRYQLLRTAGTYLIEATSAASGETGRFTLSVTRPRAPTGPTTLAQLRTDSVTSVPVGGSTDQAGIVLRGVVSDPDLSDTLRLEVEVQPVGTPFSGVATAASGRLPVGVSAFVAVVGLANNTAYHWQARTVDQTGRASAWTAFGANAETDGDVGTTVPRPPVGAVRQQRRIGDGLPRGGSGVAAHLHRAPDRDGRGRRHQPGRAGRGPGRARQHPDELQRERHGRARVESRRRHTVGHQDDRGAERRRQLRRFERRARRRRLHAAGERHHQRHDAHRHQQPLHDLARGREAARLHRPAEHLPRGRGDHAGDPGDGARQLRQYGHRVRGERDARHREQRRRRNAVRHRHADGGRRHRELFRPYH